MLSDLRQVARSLARTRGFTVTIIATLALGIGSAAAIFSVVDWVLFHANPFPGDLFVIVDKLRDGRITPMVWNAQARAYQGQTGIFSEFALGEWQTVNVALGGNPVSTGALYVSANCLPMLGATPRLGRGFLAEEEVEGRDQVVVLSDYFWKQHFNASPNVLGRKIAVDRQICTVVGVLGPWERPPMYLTSVLYRPLVVQSKPATPWYPMYVMIGRLRPGFTRQQAEAALAGTKLDISPRDSEFLARLTPTLQTIAELETIYRPEIYWMLLGAVGFLYGIACLNATNLMLIRVLGRKREISIRLAIGGGHWRIIRLLVIESLSLSLTASLVGVLIANWLKPLFMHLAERQNEGMNWASWSLNWRAIGVLAALTVVTGLAIALVPSLRIKHTDIQAGLKDEGAALGESRRVARLRALFVILQAAFAVILFTGAGLMIKTFQRLNDVSLGFDTSRRVKVQISMPERYVPKPELALPILERLQDRLRVVPGVTDVAFGSDNLMAGYSQGENQATVPDGTLIKISIGSVSPNYQKASGMVLKLGRWLDRTSASEILINESLARAYFGKESPIGQMIKSASATGGVGGWPIVGVVADVRDSLRESPGYHVYGGASWASNYATFVVQLARDPGDEMAAALRRAVYEFDPRIVTTDVVPLSSSMDRQLYYEKFALSVLNVLSGIALLLTLVGLFSVLTYTVDQRMGEFGVRVALGATPSNLMFLVIRRGMLLSGIGIAGGIAGAQALARFLQSLLFETPAHDLTVLLAVAALLAAAALAACTIPAFRASKVDVARLLKAE